MKIRFFLIAGALLLPAASFAQTIPSGSVDVYYVPKSYLTVGGFDSNGGTGYGLRGRVAVIPALFVQGEYQKDKYDGLGGVTVDTSVDLFRLGVGTHLGETPLYALAEYIHGKVDVSSSSQSDSGFGVHAGIQGTPTPILSLYGQLGYVKLGDAGDGPEYMLGGVFSVMPLVGVFADLRHSELRDNTNGKTALSDYRIGVRVSFGG